MTRQMKSQGKSAGNIFTRNWDLYVSLLLALIFLVTAWLRDENLEGVGPIFVAGLAGGVTLGATTMVTSRWVTDLLGKGEYGELVRAIDSDESNVRRPYEIVGYVCFTTAALSLVALLVYQAVPPTVLKIITSVLVGCGMYGILGSLTLIGITRRHSARAARLRTLKERNARDQRDRRRDAGNNPDRE